MDVNLEGNFIKIVNTEIDDIDKIIEFEKSNQEFVHSYPKEHHISLCNDNDCLHLSIKRIDNEKIIGHLILFGAESVNKVLEFRRITIDEKGMGYGREVIRLLKFLCFEKLGFHRLWLDVYDDNKRAINLYESEGFKKEGVLRENIISGDGYRSQRIYSMLENEYRDQKQM